MLILIHTIKTDQGFVHTITSDKKYIKSAQMIITYDRFDSRHIITQLKKYLSKSGLKPMNQWNSYDVLSNEVIRIPRKNQYLSDPEVFYVIITQFVNLYGFSLINRCLNYNG